MKTLAIETSCDDTSIGIINFDGNIFTVEKLLAYSQVKEHNEFGGVVPEIASRLHSEKIIAVLGGIGRDNIKKVDNISVTTHPGLPGSLVVGKTVASLLGEYFHKPIIEVNHIVGHIFALFLEKNIHEIKFPMVLLTASGGHNNIYYVENTSPLLSFNDKRIISKTAPIKEENQGGSDRNGSILRGNYTITQIGQTLDDAAGECFDKVSRMLGGPYPGGVRISEQAKKGKPNEKFTLSRIRLSHEEFNFSFSGVKSQIHNIISKYTTKSTVTKKTKLQQDNPFTDQEISDIAYEFQESVVEVLGKKLIRAAIKYGAQTIGLSGGVSANDRLQEYILELLENNQRIKNQNSSTCHSEGDEESIEEFIKNFNPKFLTPTKKIYCTDNAAMIGVAGLVK